MKRMLAALFLAVLTAVVGCAEGAHVERGGGEIAVQELNGTRPTGRIDVQGHVVNTGGALAESVVLHFKFYQAGTLYLEGELLLGDIRAGATADFSGSFVGPPVSAAAFTWEYGIAWD
jgi:hypothetical protein